MQGLTTLVRIPCSVDIPDDCLEDRHLKIKNPNEILMLTFSLPCDCYVLTHIEAWNKP